MIAAQHVACHNVSMKCYGRAMIGETFEVRRENLSHDNKRSRTYAVLLDALNRPIARPAEGYGRARPCAFQLLKRSWERLRDRRPPVHRDQRTNTCETNYSCTSARDAELERGAGTRAKRQRCRTADVECTADGHREAEGE